MATLSFVIPCYRSEGTLGKVVDEIYGLKETYKNNGKEFNEKAIELFIKYDIVSEENINYLREKGKLE